ncbi:MULTISPECIES: hypothetical protein [Ramlibacter]|uniref:Uncharacterized protein n=1 Tax=Ramlibacter pinisoli TaxID=2682844 RepID=A0A6N8IMR2_9BURK|nr:MULTISPECIES: hypothetical protein [Ramlibacter]MBA2960631.1 hypothetical protein [Ramlibacter sp. CGMCC 1.13660]MVQ27962.1 hypothetical protein [Ramlibacter pinisoli]
MTTTFLALLTQLLAPPAEPGADPARQLLERAGARAGHSPRQALELRQAAQAWLRVVR